MIGLIFLVISAVLGFGISYLVYSKTKFLNTDYFVPTSVVLTVVFTIVLSFMPIKFIYSNGVKTGTLTKITTKGVIFKTYEGQLNLGGAVQGGNGMVANTFNFTVLDEKIFKELTANENKQVSLKYEEWLRVPRNMGDTNYIVIDIK